MRRSLLAIAGGMFAVIPILASHGVGGQITYQCLGNGNYKILTTLYRDCMGVALGVSLFHIRYGCRSTVSASGGGTAVMGSLLAGPIDITPVCQGMCTECPGTPASGGDPTCPTGYGIEMYQFYNIINLDSFSCCWVRVYRPSPVRNTAPDNIILPSNYRVYLPLDINLCDTPCNDGPVFGTPPFLSYVWGTRWNTTRRYTTPTGIRWSSGR